MYKWNHTVQTHVVQGSTIFLKSLEHCVTSIISPNIVTSQFWGSFFENGDCGAEGLICLSLPWLLVLSEINIMNTVGMNACPKSLCSR